MCKFFFTGGNDAAVNARENEGGRTGFAARRLISRRNVFVNGAILLAGSAAANALVGAPPAAAGKVSQAQAGYKSSPNGPNECDKCSQYQPPSSCKVVDGAVSPSGSCNFFAPKPK